MEKAPAACRHPWGILASLWQTRSGCLLVLADDEPALSAWAAVCMRASKVLAALPQILCRSIGRGEVCSCCRALGLLGRQHAGGELPRPAGTYLCTKSAVPSAQPCSAAGICACPAAQDAVILTRGPEVAVSQGTPGLHSKSE